jgi:hypothetical protein
MHKKMEYQKGAEIVESALKEIRDSPFSLDSNLGDVLPTTNERGLFRERVRVRAKSHGFRIKPEDIPIEPDFTIHHIAKALAASALPGDPGVNDD